MIMLRKIQQMYNDAIFELSIIIDDIYKFFNLYNIKQNNNNKYKKLMFCAKRVLYELILLFYCIKNYMPKPSLKLV